MGNTGRGSPPPATPHTGQKPPPHQTHKSAQGSSQKSSQKSPQNHTHLHPHAAPGVYARSMNWDLTPDQQERVEVWARSVANRVTDDLDSGALEVPPMPKVALEIHRIASEEDPDVDAALKVIHRDTQLTARVLRVASSPSFGGRYPVTDIRQAVVRIGVRGLRDLAIALSMGRTFRNPGLANLLRSQNHHGYVVGCTTARICRILGLDSRYGFLCGMLHDVGKMLLLSALARYGRDDPRCRKAPYVLYLMEKIHARFGNIVAGRWQLPPLVLESTQHHHRPAMAGSAEPLVQAVTMADVAAYEAEANLDEEDLIARLAEIPIYGDAGLGPEHLRQIAEMVGQARMDADLIALSQ